MKKILAFVCLSLSVYAVSIMGCGSNASCLMTDFNGGCCIAAADCDENTPVPADVTNQALIDKCHSLGQLKKPVLCPDDFNATDHKNCVKVELVKTCNGDTDLINGKKEINYDVFCCE